MTNPVPVLALIQDKQLNRNHQGGSVKVDAWSHEGTRTLAEGAIVTIRSSPPALVRHQQRASCATRFAARPAAPRLISSR